VQLLNWSLDTEKNNLVRAATAKALGKCGNLATIDRLMILVADANNGVRDMAAASIVRLSINLGPKKEIVASTGQ
jgi:HEAT repeat protein